MSETQTTPPALFGGRYEIISQDAQGQVEARDYHPWRRCWACGSTGNAEGESFCTDCGATLDRRVYRGVLGPSASVAGPALIDDVADETARALLPALWDLVVDGDQTLALIQDSGRPPVTSPLDEIAALRAGTALARLLAALHRQNLALGGLTPADLELNAAGRPTVRNVAGLCRFADEERGDAVSADLLGLAALLEALADTPRTTQRLSEDEALDAIAEPDLATVLRQVRTQTITSAETLAERLDVLLAARTRVPALSQRIGALSDTGVVRDHNEDSLLTLSLVMDNTSVPRTWGCFIVADGMGGHAAGEVASGLAIRGAAEVILSEYMAPTLDLDAEYDEKHISELVRKAALQANEYVLHEGRTRGNDMGSTLTMALVVGDRAVVANVGDSRTYLLREGRLRRVSKDHSLVQRLVDLGQISADDAYSHPQRNAVLRSLGDKPDVEVDLFVERLKPGDILMLCSDGQWEMTRDPEMERIITQHDDPQVACQKLIEAANQAGGEDNITTILVRFE